MRAIALPPRLARMLVEAKASGEAELAAEVSVLLTERNLGGDGADLVARIERFRRERGGRADDAHKLVKSLLKQADANGGRTEATDAGRHLAAAFPDRIAKARGKPGEFLMANGRAASLEPHDALAREAYLAIGEISGRAAAAHILLAAPLTLTEIETLAGADIVTRDDLQYDVAREKIVARRQRRLGALVLAEQTLSAADRPDAARSLAEGIAQSHFTRLPWSKGLGQWRDRVNFLRINENDDIWPDLSDATLQAGAADWLAPYLSGKAALSDIETTDLETALHALLPYDMQRRLEAEAPTHFETPAGSRIAVDYAAENGPLVSARVQEFYGLDQHPALAKGKAPLTLELLSPAHRPVQITRDLPGFWRGSWTAVKTDMKGRYPRHLWPDDPAKAAPTSRAKPRGT
jgi:ATP-dependent helicase HrpB